MASTPKPIRKLAKEVTKYARETVKEDNLEGKTSNEEARKNKKNIPSIGKVHKKIKN